MKIADAIDILETIAQTGKQTRGVVETGGESVFLLLR